LPVQLFQLWLGIKRIHLTGPAIHVQKNHSACTRAMMVPLYGTSSAIGAIKLISPTRLLMMQRG
jgi:hypothetical protein